MAQGQPMQKKIIRLYLKEQIGNGGSHHNPSYAGGIGKRNTIQGCCKVQDPV
jgi:hypothetical protein